MGDPAAGQRGLRGGDGACAGCLSASLQSGLSGGVHGRDAPPVDRRDPQTDSSGAGAAHAPRLRVSALGNLQRVHGDRAVGRVAHDQGHGPANQDRLGALPPRHRRAIRRCRARHPGDGQPQHPPPRRPLRDLPPGRGQGAGTASSSSTPPSTAVGSTSPRSSSTS